MKEARGQNKLFHNASLLMCYCSFAIGQFLLLKDQSERQAIELLFKVQISLDHPSSNTKWSCVITYISIPFCELYNVFNGISHKKLFAVFLPNRWEFLSDYLDTYSGQKSQQIAGKKVLMPSEIKLLARTKIYFCFNSKGDNFKVNQH